MENINSNNEEMNTSWDLEFGFDDEIVQSSGGGGSKLFPIEAQVNNVKLDSAEYGTTDGGSEYVTFSWSRRTDSGVSQTMNGREYQVTKDDEVYLLRGEDKRMALTRKNKQFNGRLLEVAKAFGVDVSPSGLLRTTIKKSNNFKSFIEKYCEILVKEGTGTAYMKVMRNQRGYPCHPKYGAFLQAMEEGVESSLSYSVREIEINAANDSSTGVSFDDDDDIDDTDAIDGLEVGNDEDVITKQSTEPTEDSEDEW